MSTPTPAVSVTAIAFTAYPVTDITRARAFYEALLGLQTGVTYEHEGKAWIEYDIGPGTIAISNMGAENWQPSANGPSVALEVADFDGAVAALRAGRARFAIEPMDSGVCRMAGVLDPDGNSLMIHQRRPAKD